MKQTPYGIVKDLYPDHWVFFQWMQERAKIIGTEFSRDASGFLEFVEYVGPIPRDMKRPSLGRKDHDKGYVRENFGWQEMSDNNHEVHSRSSRMIKLGERIPEETRKKMSDSAFRRWSRRLR